MAPTTSFVIPTSLLTADESIPTTLDGPFKPSTLRFDSFLRRGSYDLPLDHLRLRKRNVSSDFPQQIALALSTPTSMWVSWVTGDAMVGKDVKPLDFKSVSSEVWYEKEKGNYTQKKKGNATVYSQLYPFDGLLNYTSGIVHHVLIDGLEPETKYYYKCGDGSVPAMSDKISFETLHCQAKTHILVGSPLLGI